MDHQMVLHLPVPKHLLQYTARPSIGLILWKYFVSKTFLCYLQLRIHFGINPADAFQILSQVQQLILGCRKLLFLYLEVLELPYKFGLNSLENSALFFIKRKLYNGCRNSFLANLNLNFTSNF